MAQEPAPVATMEPAPVATMQMVTAMPVVCGAPVQCGAWGKWKANVKGTADGVAIVQVNKLFRGDPQGEPGLFKIIVGSAADVEFDREIHGTTNLAVGGTHVIERNVNSSIGEDFRATIVQGGAFVELEPAPVANMEPVPVATMEPAPIATMEMVTELPVMCGAPVQC